MAKLIYSMMVSLDGFVETTDKKLDWVLVDDELHAFSNEYAREAGTFLYGRGMYETMAGYWPTADENPEAVAVEVEFARIWRPKPKVVFSRTLEKVDWNSRLVRENAVEEVARLKEQPGGDLGVGGATLAATFIRAGLVDEYRPIVQPVVLGAGTPFLPALEKPIGLRLVETRRFDSGVVYLRYVV